MNAITAGFDPITFPRRLSWKRRLSAWLNREEPLEVNPHLGANADAIASLLTNEESGMRMVVNMPATGLLGFIRDKRYKNAYERPIVAGGPSNSGNPMRPSKTREKVDSLVFGDEARHYYFGAVALGGTGIRFYGDYCAILKTEVVSQSTRVFDRNSYDLVRPPLEDIDDKERLVATLRGTWGKDLVDMITLKALPYLLKLHRLITAGAVADSVLHDEEFVEVHRRGTFSPQQIEEIRIPPEDVVLQKDIGDRLARGVLPTPEELLWVNRRVVVEEEMARERIPVRIVVSSGRGSRWR